MIHGVQKGNTIGFQLKKKNNFITSIFDRCTLVGKKNENCNSIIAVLHVFTRTSQYFNIELTWIEGSGEPSDYLFSVVHFIIDLLSFLSRFLDPLNLFKPNWQNHPYIQRNYNIQMYLKVLFRSKKTFFKSLKKGLTSWPIICWSTSAKEMYIFDIG